MELLVSLGDHMIFAAIPALGFALVFNVPVKTLIYCALLGAIAYGTRYILMHNGLAIEWSTFFAATLIGMIGVRVAHKLKTHPKVFTVAAVIPMIPGVYAFKAMIALVEMNNTGYSAQLMSVMTENYVRAMFIIAGLAVGLALPGLLFYRKRPLI